MGRLGPFSMRGILYRKRSWIRGWAKVNWICACLKKITWRFYFHFLFLKGNYVQLKPTHPDIPSATHCRRPARAPILAYFIFHFIYLAYSSYFHVNLPTWRLPRVRKPPAPRVGAKCWGPQGGPWFSSPG